MSYSLCALIGGNTGIIGCDIVRGNPAMIIAGGAVFAPSDYPDLATFDENFADKFLLPAGSADKLFSFPVIQGTTDKTVAAKFGTLGYGLSVKLLRSKAGYEFQVEAGSTLEKQLMKFDGQTVPLFILDDENQLAGIADSAGNYQGANYLIGVEPRSYGDAQNAKTTTITISIINSKDFTENAVFVRTQLNTTDLAGLNDVTFNETGAHTSNVYHIAAKIITSDLLNPIDVFAKYSTALAAAGMYTAFTGPTFGTALTITSVARTSTGMDVTFDSTAFTALSTGAFIKFNFAAPSVLDDADVTSTEGIPIILTK